MREGPVEEDLIPAGIRKRLFTSITDPDWNERIVVAAQGRAHQATRPEIKPFYWTTLAFFLCSRRSKAIKLLIET
jgi:hypothetical protein